MSKDISHKPDRMRRLIVQGAVAGSVAGLALPTSIVWSPAHAAADAAQWPKDAFQQKGQDEAIKSLYGKTAEESDQVKLDAPEIAENGAVVPITVSSTLADVTSVSIFVTENPFPLAASYKIPSGTQAMVGGRLKMAKTSKVLAVVESGGKLYSASKEIKVTVGGCGG